MAVTVNVFRQKGNGKRGSPVTNAEFKQLFQQPKQGPGFPGPTQYVPLAISTQNGGQYVLAPAPDPYNTTAFTLRAEVPGVAEVQEFGIRNGEVVEVRLGYER